MQYIIDLDDFCESNTDWKLIELLKEKVPDLKLNLFTIPGKCSWKWIEKMRKIDWIQIIPHGWMHETSRECENWIFDECDKYLGLMEVEGWIHGFKAPGWQISQDMYLALLERDWWVADQIYNNDRRLEQLRTYLLDSPNKIHGHVGHWGAKNINSLEFIYNQIADLRGEFLFIDDLWKLI